MIDAVLQVGWTATGVVVSKGTYSEHSAVIVFDPKWVPEDQVLAAGAGRPVHVLDAWRRDDADIYPLHTWLKLPLIRRSPPQIKPLRGPSQAPPDRRLSQRVHSGIAVKPGG